MDEQDDTPEAPPPPAKTPRKRGKRNSAVLAMERLDMMDAMLRSCMTHAAIDAILRREWGVSNRQLRNYRKAVYDRWQSDSRHHAVSKVAVRRAQLEGVLERAMNPGKDESGKERQPDLRTAVLALDRLCKVDGAYAPERVEHTGLVGVDVGAMRASDREAKLKELFTKYREHAAKKPADE